MAGRNKAQVVDGLVTLRATQRAAREKHLSSKAPPPADKASEELSAKQKNTGSQPVASVRPPAAARTLTPASGGGKRPVHFGRTVLPTENDVACYTCGFHFIMRGKANVTQCPKCHARLTLNDETIAAPFAGEIITAGKVVLTKNAVLDGGTIIANDIVLEGRVEKGTLRALGTLELTRTAEIPESVLDAYSLRIGEGASFDFTAPLSLQDVEVIGELKATITAGGTVRVHRTGHLLGTVEAPHLIVDEGGGLNADCRIVSPESNAEAESTAG